MDCVALVLDVVLVLALPEAQQPLLVEQGHAPSSCLFAMLAHLVELLRSRLLSALAFLRALASGFAL